MNNSSTPVPDVYELHGVSRRLKNFVPFADPNHLTTEERRDLFAGEAFLRRIAEICVQPLLREELERLERARAEHEKR